MYEVQLGEIFCLVNIIIGPFYQIKNLKRKLVKILKIKSFANLQSEKNISF